MVKTRLGTEYNVPVAVNKRFTSRDIVYATEQDHSNDNAMYSIRTELPRIEKAVQEYVQRFGTHTALLEKDFRISLDQ